MACTPAPIPPLPLYSIRLSVLFAAKANVAVVLRRGPKRHFRLILWDLSRDTFELGQWMKGKISLCDLAPDGKKLIYWAAQYHRPTTPRQTRTPTSQDYEPLAERSWPKPTRTRRRVPRYQRIDATSHHKLRTRPIGETWTAISTPPYFTALAFWPALNTYTGGGIFLGDRTVAINEQPDAMTPIENVSIPRSFQILRYDHTQPNPVSAIRPMYARAAQPASVAWDTLTAHGFDVEWLSEHAAPDLLYAANGCIYRLANWQSVPSSEWAARAKRLYDFRPMSFEQIVAPAPARSWG